MTCLAIRLPVLFVGLALLLLLSERAYPSDEIKIQVEVVRQPSYFKPRSSVDWKEVRKGQEVPVDSLLQVMEGGGVRLKYILNESNTYVFSFQHPVVLRMSRDLLRKMDVSEVYLKDTKGFEFKAPNPEDLLAFSSGWKRLTAVFDRGIAQVRTLFGVKGGVGSYVAKQHKSIRMLTPYHNQNIISDDRPHGHRVAWHHPDDLSQRQYEVFFWSHTDEKPKKGFTTTNDHFTVDVPKSGRYFIRVESKNGEFASQSTLINFFTETEYLQHKSPAGTTDDSGLASAYWKLIHPAQSARWIGESGGAKVSFRWQEMTATDRYDFVIKGVDSDFVLEESIPHPYYHRQLEPGLYRWHVKTKVSGKSIQSEERTLRVSFPSTTQTLAAMIDSWQPLKADKVVYSR